MSKLLLLELQRTTVLETGLWSGDSEAEPTCSMCSCKREPRYPKTSVPLCTGG